MDSFSIVKVFARIFLSIRKEMTGGGKPNFIDSFHQILKAFTSNQSATTHETTRHYQTDYVIMVNKKQLLSCSETCTLLTTELPRDGAITK